MQQGLNGLNFKQLSDRMDKCIMENLCFISLKPLGESDWQEVEHSRIGTVSVLKKFL